MDGLERRYRRQACRRVGVAPRAVLLSLSVQISPDRHGREKHDARRGHAQGCAGEADRLAGPARHVLRPAAAVYCVVKDGQTMGGG